MKWHFVRAPVRCAAALRQRRVVCALGSAALLEAMLLALDAAGITTVDLTAADVMVELERELSGAAPLRSRAGMRRLDADRVCMRP